MSTPLERAVELIETALGDLDDWQEQKNGRFYAGELIGLWRDLAAEQGRPFEEVAKERALHMRSSVIRSHVCERCWAVLDDSQEYSGCRSCLAAEQDARWVVTGRAPDGTLWRREGTGFEALQATLKEARESGVGGIRTKVR